MKTFSFNKPCIEVTAHLILWTFHLSSLNYVFHHMSHWITQLWDEEGCLRKKHTFNLLPINISLVTWQIFSKCNFGYNIQYSSHRLFRILVLMGLIWSSPNMMQPFSDSSTLQSSSALNKETGENFKMMK